jgi:hypothetical protein
MEAIEKWIAWHLPRRVVYWCVVRGHSQTFQRQAVWATEPSYSFSALRPQAAMASGLHSVMAEKEE